MITWPRSGGVRLRMLAAGTVPVGIGGEAAGWDRENCQQLESHPVGGRMSSYPFRTGFGSGTRRPTREPSVRRRG